MMSNRVNIKAQIVLGAQVYTGIIAARFCWVKDMDGSREIRI
jgi:hypothetical protein